MVEKRGMSMGAKSKIDWCDATFNPVTGCLHGCEYCYARRIAERFGGFEPRCGGEDIPEDKKKYGKNSVWNNTQGETLHVFSGRPMKRIATGVWQKASYPYNFEPTFHRYKLDEPQKWKKGRNIFVCSMADLFGGWVPDEWIEEVFAACEKAPQHRYLFLTKNPKRYAELYESEKIIENNNMWYGVSITNGKSMIKFINFYDRTPFRIKKFLSIEPILSDICKTESWSLIGGGICKIDWVIIGAETGNRKNKITPKRDWIEKIVLDCYTNSIPVFMKESLAKVWGEPLIQEYPEGLRKENWNDEN